MNEERLITLLTTNFPTRVEFSEFRKEVLNKFENLEEKLDEPVLSSRVLDTLLEQHPIERIQRVERCVGLGPYITPWTGGDLISKTKLQLVFSKQTLWSVEHENH